MQRIGVTVVSVLSTSRRSSTGTRMLSQSSPSCSASGMWRVAARPVPAHAARPELERGFARDSAARPRGGPVLRAKPEHGVRRLPAPRPLAPASLRALARSRHDHAGSIRRTDALRRQNSHLLLTLSAEWRPTAPRQQLLLKTISHSCPLPCGLEKARTPFTRTRSSTRRHSPAGGTSWPRRTSSSTRHRASWRAS